MPLYDTSTVIRAIDEFTPALSALDAGLTIARDKWLGVKDAEAVTNVETKKVTMGFTAAANQMNRMTYGLRSLSRDLNMISLPMAFVGYHAVKTSATFQHSMNMIRGITGATTESVNDLRESTIKLAAAAGSIYVPEEIAAGELTAAKYLKTTKQVQQFTAYAVKFGKANQETFSEASEDALHNMATWGLSMKDIPASLDKVTYAGTKAHTSTKELSAAQAYAAPTARDLNTSQSETLAVLAMLSKENLKGTRAGRGYESMLESLATPTKEATKFLTQMGIKTRDVHQHFLGLNKIMSQISKLNLKEKTEFFKVFLGTQYALRPAEAIAGTQAAFATYQAIEKGIAGSAGTVDRINKAINDTTTASQHLKAGWQALEIAMVDPAVLNEITNIEGKVTDMMLSMAKTSPHAKHLFDWLFLIGGLAGPLLSVGFKLGAIVYFLRLFTKEKTIGSIFAGGWLAWITLLIAGLVLIIKYRKQIKHFLSEFVTGKIYVDELTSSVKLLDDAFKPLVKMVEYLSKKFEGLSKARKSFAVRSIEREFAAIPGIGAGLSVLHAASLFEKSRGRGGTAAPSAMHVTARKPQSEQQLMKSLLHISVNDPTGVIGRIGTSTDSPFQDISVGRSMVVPSI